jgi:amidase
MRFTRRAAAAAPFAFAAARAWAAAPPHPGPPSGPPAPVSPWPDATALAQAIRSGQVSPTEAVEDAIRRAGDLQGRLNFMVTSDFERALDKARLGPRPGPFGGVPFLIKDLDDYRGLPTRFGSQAGRLAPPATEQTPLMDAYDRAGVIVIGKSATSEAGFLPTVEPLAFGPTHNPWNLTRSSGGSSGGTAAAVSAGVVTAGEATDGGGSIRIPASCCGLFGLKPSRGRMVGTMDERRITDFASRHVLTRSVRDSAGFFAATEDTGIRAQRPPVGFVMGPAKRRLRVGVLLENNLGHRPHDDVVAANDAAVKLLAELGHHMDYAHLPFDGSRFIDDFLLFWASGAADFADTVARHAGRPVDESLIEPFSLGLVELFRKTPKEALPPVLQRLEANALAYDTWFPAHQFDVVLSPVVSAPPPTLGYIGPSVPFDTLMARLREYVGYTPIHNIAGAPAMSVPLHWTRDDLPIGSMFSGRPGDEAMLFQLAYELELARPWAGRVPPVRA